jgi:hypothetical protein
MAATAAVLDFVFKSAVSVRVDSHRLSHFFGVTYAAVNGVALVVQFALAPFLLRRLGAVYALVVLPLLLTAGAVGFLIAMLAHRDARAEAQQAIVAVGPTALSALAEALSDGSTPVAVRRHLPLTIQRFGTAEAAAILTGQLAVEKDGPTRFKIVRGLGRMRAVDPDLALDEAPLRTYARASADRVLELIAWRLALPEGAELELLITLLREKERHSLERLFRILGLLYPHVEMHAVYRSLRRGDQRRREAAAEVLAHVLDGDLRQAVQLLVDELEDAERLRRARVAVPERAVALAAMAVDHSVALQAVVSYLERQEPRGAAPLLERGAEAGT